MADRQARVRLALQSGAFLGGIEQARTKAEAAFRSIASVGSKVGKGMWHGGKQGLESMVEKSKELVGIAAAIGGGFSLERALDESMHLQSRFRDIAFTVNKLGGETKSWKDVQEEIEGAAKRTSRTTSEMADAYESVFKATGDTKTASASLDVIGAAATNSGTSVQQLASLVPMLQEKFHIAAADIPQAFASMFNRLDTGGANIDDIGLKFELMAGEASDAGLDGAAGMAKLLDISNMLDDRLGKKSSMALKQLLQQLRDGGPQLAAFKKATGIDLGKMQGLDKLKGMLSGKGRKQAELMFTGDMRPVFEKLVEPFDQAVAKAKAAGKKTKDAQAEGVAAFETMLRHLGKSGGSVADLMDQAAKRAKDDPMAQVRKAQETLAQAFSDPEMMAAIGELAKELPALAKGAARFTRFFVENPLLGTASVFGGRAALGAVSGGAGAVPGLYRSAIAARNVAGLQAGLAALSGDSGAMKTAGTNFAKAAARANAWNEAGKALGAAVALAVAYEVGKSFIEDQLNKDEKGNTELNSARAQVQALTKFGGTTEEKLAAAKKLQEAQDKVAKGKTNLTTEAFGTAAAWITGDKSLDPDARKSSNISGASNDLKALLATMGNGAQAADKAADAHERLAKAASKTADALSKIGAPAGGGHGLPPKPGNAPGYIPPPS